MAKLCLDAERAGGFRWPGSSAWRLTGQVSMVAAEAPQTWCRKGRRLSLGTKGAMGWPGGSTVAVLLVALALSFTELVHFE